MAVPDAVPPGARPDRPTPAAGTAVPNPARTPECNRSLRLSTGKFVVGTFRSDRNSTGPTGNESVKNSHSHSGME